MSLSVGFDLAPTLGLGVSPGLVAFGEMLMLPREDLQEFIDDQLDANDALERLDPDACPLCKDSWRDRCPVCTRHASGPKGVAAERTAAVIEDPARVPDSQTLLLEVLVESPRLDPAVAEYVVGSLDRHGFLGCSVEDLAVSLGTDMAATAAALDAVRRVGPPGVGACDVSDCLLLQLDALGLQDECARLARDVIADHLPALARGSFSAIATALGVSDDDVRDALALIRNRLRPFPAFDGNDVGITHFVAPDVLVVEKHGCPGEFDVELVEPALVRLRVRSEANVSAAAAADARALLFQLRGRWDTLGLIARYVVHHQRAYLLEGPGALRPLTRAQVAAALGIHESTVSRAVAHKFVLLPDRTIVPLARFFTVSGGMDEELRLIIQADSGRPLSDQRIAELLTRAGYPVARRTVAKHRARLGIAAAPLR